VGVTIGLLLGGLVLISITLRDVFDTVVVPGGSRASLRIARRFSQGLLPIWRGLRGRRKGISTTFAPLVLVLSFVTWMLLLDLGFGLVGYALRDEFRPQLTSFPDALFVMGSGLVTIGLTGTDATGAARWATLGAGFCGLAVMTMAVTYLLEVQGSISRRDSGILKLTTSAGDPPTAVALLEKYARLGCRKELGQVLLDGRDWCASVLQSHAAHPSLIYFRTTGTGSGWVAAVGTLIDLALLLEHVVDEGPLSGRAVLLREGAVRMIERLAKVTLIDPHPVGTSETEFATAIARLSAAGYQLRGPESHRSFLAARAAPLGYVAAVAHHLGAEATRLLPAT
jgi:hypothetical protein